MNYITIQSLSEKSIERIQNITHNGFNKNEIISKWNNIKNINCNLLEISMDTSVSSGTYIRQFCHDIGKQTSYGGIAFDIYRYHMKYPEILEIFL